MPNLLVPSPFRTTFPFKFNLLTILLPYILIGHVRSLYRKELYRAQRKSESFNVKLHLEHQ